MTRIAWGKRSRKPGNDRIHPLVHHCLEAAACFRRLLDLPTIRRSLARAAGLDDLDQVQGDRLAVLAGWHDMGKANHGFQAKGDSARRREHAGHTREVWPLLAGDPNQPRSPEALAIILRWLPPEWFVEASAGLVRLILVILAHHGRPLEPNNFSGKELFQFRSLWSATDEADPLTEWESLGIALQSLLPGAYGGGGGALPSQPAFQHHLLGLVTLADWLASDDRLFPFARDPDRSPDPKLIMVRAGAALNDVGLDPTNHRIWITAHPPAFGAVTGHPAPRAAQTAIAEMVDASPGGLALLEAETGAGKTEAAFWRFLQLFQAGEVDGLYFALPTRAAATQIFERIRVLRNNAFGPLGPPVVLAVPGYLRVDDVEGARLARFETLWPDEAGRRGWAAENSKRFLAGAIVVGTVDQVLLAGLAVRHAHLRFVSLARSLLVVDEVHASDGYMSEILAAVLDRHRERGGHALLMSATLGAAARARFFRAPGQTAVANPPPFTEAVTLDYPMIHGPVARQVGTGKPNPTHGAGGATASPTSGRGIQREGLGKSVTIALAPLAEDVDSVARQALAAADQGARVLILRNTVTGVREAQKSLERAGRSSGKEDLLFRVGGRAAPHHSRFSPLDRTKLDQRVEALFGVEAAQDGPGVVLCATQTVEQSLDIDADWLVTDLAPLDVLLQRLGRLHRHRRRDPFRPRRFSTPKALVLVPEVGALEEMINPQSGEGRGPHGWGTVYADLTMLGASWEALIGRGVIQIPADNRLLVESATHPERLEGFIASRDPEVRDLWEKHCNALYGMGASHAIQARMALLRDDSREGDLAASDFTFRGNDPAERLVTRLGAEPHTVRFAPPPVGPFGELVEKLDLPDHFWPEGCDSDATPSVSPDNGGFRFHLADRVYYYDRLGLTQLENP